MSLSEAQIRQLEKNYLTALMKMELDTLKTEDGIQT